MPLLESSAGLGTAGTDVGRSSSDIGTVRMQLLGG
jgi:hypothetical protein